MPEIHVLAPPKRNAEAEIVGILEGVLASARDGRVSTLTIGYFLHVDGADPEIVTDSAGDTTERLACASMMFRRETDED